MTKGTSNDPFVTVKALEAPVSVTQVPLPENVPTTRVDETDVMATVPLAKLHTNWKLVLFCVVPKAMVTPVHCVAVQLELIVLLPTVSRPMLTTAKSHVVLVFGTTAIASMICVAASLVPAAHGAVP